MRSAELFGLRWEQIDFAGGFVKLKAGSTKNNDGRNIPMTTRVRVLLEELRANATKADAQDTLFQITGHYVGGLVRQFFDENKVPDISLHTCRHTFATRLAQAGTHPFFIKELMGHRNLYMSSYYTHAVPDAQRDAINSLEKRAGRTIFQQDSTFDSLAKERA